jgi:3-methylcrotonyl-CoA carboxylase alpha subunit
MKITKILVANRGEIALRTMRTCHAMGISTVAVYSEADAAAPFVRFADEAVCIGPAPAMESYLVANKIFDAARQTAANAIHPGYGFLSENADFAEAVADNGLVFVGPSAKIIRALGKKREAKLIAMQAGVPVVPGYNETAQDDSSLIAAAKDVGFPLLIKASAGGGGKGMRIVRNAESLPSSLASARSEAMSSFADSTLILERYIERPRHIEVQILGDKHGGLVHLWERECSIQRRHQKIVEETPAPGLAPALRERIAADALAIGRQVGYDNAGTVEFVVGPDGAHYFLEVNTRLQVEHPVTEMTTGVDLVEEQILAAGGAKLRFATAPQQRGCAVEVRWCAEDPMQDCFPTTGILLALRTSTESEGVRFDLGVEAGATIPVHYDSMLGKIIGFGGTRELALSRLQRALANLWAPGLVSNQSYLQRILAHPAFVAGDLHTHFLADHAGELTERSPGLDVLRVAVTAVIIAQVEKRRGQPYGDGPALTPGWRNVRFSDQTETFVIHGSEVDVGYYFPRSRGCSSKTSAMEVVIGSKRLTLTTTGATFTDSNHCEVWWEESGGLRRKCLVAFDSDGLWVACEQRMLHLILKERFPQQKAALPSGSMTAPMPGKLIRIAVAIGDSVKTGDVLLVLEAMKMEHTVVAAIDGTVAELAVRVGEQVTATQLLLRIEASS